MAWSTPVFMPWRMPKRVKAKATWRIARAVRAGLRQIPDQMSGRYFTRGCLAACLRCQPQMRRGGKRLCRASLRPGLAVPRCLHERHRVLDLIGLEAEPPRDGHRAIRRLLHVEAADAHLPGQP